jgi:hypothetical protein
MRVAQPFLAAGLRAPAYDATVVRGAAKVWTAVKRPGITTNLRAAAADQGATDAARLCAETRGGAPDTKSKQRRTVRGSTFVEAAALSPFSMPAIWRGMRGANPKNL